SEHNQTVNALLNELDGFDGSEGIVVIAATNRLEDLDPALIRPGRFDKHLMVNLPDQKARLQIIKMYAKNKKLADDVDLEDLAKLTIGFSGAALEALLNEAAILAANKHQSVITYEEIDEAYYKTVMKGSKKKSRNEEMQHKELVAWHESGHALCAKLLTDMEIPKVTIVPSTTGAAGVTFITPRKMGMYSKQDLLNNIKIRYAGRAAEYLLLGDEELLTTGASNDIEQATAHIREMITTYGMHPRFGMLSLKELNVNAEAMILEEASKLAKLLYEETVQLLADEKETLEQIAKALIEKETLDEDELDKIIAEYSSLERVS
ncbi:MAG: AAA family ATPase, partial [Desulfitobacterium sp.]|nr:AAA family ATPase [Desulfitobacterium sp.]